MIASPNRTCAKGGVRRLVGVLGGRVKGHVGSVRVEDARCARSGYEELSLAAKVEVSHSGSPKSWHRWHGVGSYFSSSSLIARSPSHLWELASCSLYRVSISCLAGLRQGLRQSQGEDDVASVQMKESFIMIYNLMLYMCNYMYNCIYIYGIY